MNPSNAIVEFRGVRKRFGRLEALCSVDCSIPTGKITALVGDNGAGKTTLTKIICGVHRPDEGEFLFGGKPTRWRNPEEARKHGIETVYQDLALVDQLSVGRNFFLGKEPSAWGFMNRQQMNQDALAGVAELGIQLRDAEEPVGRLSGGQRKSIAIARSLYFHPRLLILDEPTAALSIKESRVVLQHVAHVREQGIPVIFITHNIHLIYPIADRFLLLDQGRKLCEIDKSVASPDELIDAIVQGQPILSSSDHDS